MMFFLQLAVGMNGEVFIVLLTCTADIPAGNGNQHMVVGVVLVLLELFAVGTGLGLLGRLGVLAGLVVVGVGIHGSLIQG